MKDYDFLIKLEFGNYGIEGKNQKDAKENLKEGFYEEYGIKLKKVPAATRT